MAELTIHFETDDSIAPEQAKAELESKLSGLGMVQSAQVHAAQYRSLGPTEIIAAIGIVMAVAKSSTEAVQAITSLVSSLKDLVKAGKGLKDAFLEIGMRKVSVSQITPADIDKLAQRAAG